MPALAAFIASSLAFLAGSAHAQDADPFGCGQVSGMQTELDEGFEYRISAFLWYEPAGASTRVELATLDAEQGLALNPTAWGELLDGDFGLQGDQGLDYDPEHEGPLFVATLPAPAHDLRLETDRGELTVRLPDTRDLRFGAAFAVADDGATYWAEQDHDGLSVEDRLDWDDALADEHLARAAHEAAGDPGAPDDAQPLELAAAKRSTWAYAADPAGASLRLGKPDGSSIEPEEVPALFGTYFDVLDEGVSVGSSRWQGATGRAFPLSAQFQDLSDCSGWPEVEVKPGVLAVDPRYGRFAFSQGRPEQDPELAGHFHQHWNAPNSLQVYGDRAWFTLGESDASFVMVDISDPAAPQLAGMADAGWAYGSVLAEGCAHVWGKSGIVSFDISDESAPRATQWLEHDWGVPGAVWQDGELLVASYAEGLVVFDITNPAHPRVLDDARLRINDELQAWSNTTCWPVSTNLAIAPVSEPEKEHSHEALRLYDISDPFSPQLLSTIHYADKEVELGPVWVDRTENAMFLGTVGDGLKLVDLRDPTEPLVETLRREYDVDSEDEIQWVDRSTGLGEVGGVLYESGSYGWLDANRVPPWDGRSISYLRAWDISDPLNPELLQVSTDASTVGWLGSLAEADEFAVAAESGYGLRLLDPAAEDPFDYMGGYLAAGQTTDVEVAGDIAHISGYLGGGITAVDISDPSQPVQVGYAHHGLDTYGIALKSTGEGSWVYASGKSRLPWFEGERWRYTEVTVHDFADPGAPVELGQGTGDFHLVADSSGDLLWADCNLWDISDPADPIQLNEKCVLGGQAAAFMDGVLVYGGGGTELSGGYLDEGKAIRALVIYDVGIPAASLLLSLQEVPDSVGGVLSTNVALRGEKAYFVNGVGVVEADVSDPREPVRTDYLVIDSCPEGDPESLDVAGDHLYVQCQHWTVLVYDISQGLAEAVELGALESHVGEITKLSGYQLLSATANGLYLYDVPRSPDEPVGPVTVSYYEADAPAGDPAECGSQGVTGCSCAAGPRAPRALGLALLGLAALAVGRRGRGGVALLSLALLALPGTAWANSFAGLGVFIAGVGVAAPAAVLLLLLSIVSAVFRLRSRPSRGRVIYGKVTMVAAPVLALAFPVTAMVLELMDGRLDGAEPVLSLLAVIGLPLFLLGAACFGLAQSVVRRCGVQA